MNDDRLPSRSPKPGMEGDQFLIPPELMKASSGSDRRDFSEHLMNQVAAAMPVPPGQREQAGRFMVEATMAFRPTDEVEGLLVAQAIALHHMCMRSAALAAVPEQPAAIAHQLRKSAIHASRQFGEVLATLDRKRGRGGQQRVRVEHVHVHQGGQAIVGSIEAGGGGGREKLLPQPHDPVLAAPADVGECCPALRGYDPTEDALRQPGHAERTLLSPRRPIDRSAHRGRVRADA